MKTQFHNYNCETYKSQDKMVKKKKKKEEEKYKHTCLYFPKRHLQKANSNESKKHTYTYNENIGIIFQTNTINILNE